LTGYLSLPCFNDVHHVRPNQDGNYLIVNTGLDMVVEVDPIKTTILREWNVLGHPPWERFSKTIDYRKVLTTKPHQSHPNYVFQIGNDIWVTRCLQMDAVCLTKPNQSINLGGAYVHDGIVVGDSIYFTKVDGHIVIVDGNSLKVKKEYNLNLFSNAKQSLGWCRGIKVLDENTVIVGFSRIRSSKNSPVDAPLLNIYNNVLPTRICCYNLTDGKLLWEHPLEQYGVNAVFSLHTNDEYDKDKY
jgi:outer membrane protein assembly factor BamB